MSRIATFIDMCVAGSASPSQIDDWIDRWHEGGEPGTLAEFLGLSSEEYACWVARPESLAEILSAHRTQMAASSSGTPSR